MIELFPIGLAHHPHNYKRPTTIGSAFGQSGDPLYLNNLPHCCQAHVDSDALFERQSCRPCVTTKHGNRNNSLSGVNDWRLS
ncbi:hypothetical protein AG1IA_06090 [Rhizoctonia solani AG-1 IA]|uniref:Uncharacterized protein n=1 Tax=Thanatephorus cucumeris (strain AG1-IA) TaxID=983506 RepID=L8WT10_THACA|nr:hypothetical protein AG1IA_06090 [Rhizoctonia solani AG-1 IA]